MSDKTPRNIKADVIRGFAIISVILGHCIQQGNGLEYYNDSRYWFNKMYQFIYSFHMPLFMLLAGWFAFYSIKKLEGDRKKQWLFLLKRAFLYVFPIFFWTLFEFVRGFYINRKLGNETASFSELVPQFLSYFLTNLWFLWAILICLVIVFVMHFYLKDNAILYGIGFLGLFVITDDMNLGVYKYLLPYYIGAFYTNMYKEKLSETRPGRKLKELYSRKSLLVLLLLAIVFAGLFAVYNDRVFIYRSGYRISRAILFEQIAVDMYRMIIGFAGSGFFIVFWDIIVSKVKNYSWPVLSTFGKNSLGIYIFQGYYILLVMTNYTNDLEPHWWIVLIETISVCAVSLVSAVVVDKIQVLRCIEGRKPFREINIVSK